MSVTSASIGHSFDVSAVTKQVTVDTFINIVKRKEVLLYRTTVGSAAAGIAYAAGEPVTSDTCLSIADRSTSLAGNRATRSNYTTISGTKYFTIDTDNFVVTDVFVSPQATITATPLFYVHVLNTVNVPRVDESTLVLQENVKILSVEFLDLAFQPVKVTEQYFDETTGRLYNNLESYYKSVGNYNYYYVKYTVRVDDTVYTYIELLDNQTAYRVATYTDLDQDLQIITDGRKVYLIEETETGFEVTLPMVGVYAFKSLSTARLRILPPVTNSPQDPWYVRVTNGKFYAEVGGLNRKYYISEFFGQTFMPEPPYKSAGGIIPEILTTTVLKADHTNLIDNPDLEMGLSIVINDADANAIAAFTTLESMEGLPASNGKNYQRWSALNPTGIRSVDHINGLIDLDGITLTSTYQISMTYYYEETTYVFSLVNFNPIGNKDVLANKIVLFIDPDDVTTKEQTLFYLKVDPSGQVIESNWSQFNNITQRMTEGTPPHWLFLDTCPAWKEALVDAEAGTWRSFSGEFSTEGSGSYLILAEMTVAVRSSPDDIQIIDSRVRGGGIVEDQYSEVLMTHPEAAWCWDVSQWDGLPYPGNATYLVEVPSNVLEVAGGIFNQDQVIDIVKRHTGLGIYPVVRAYGETITVSGVAREDAKIPIDWPTGV